ncbi:MAG: hypothetical protein ACI89P_001470, partial [Colwellia sp.]
GDNFQDILMKQLPEKHQASFIKLSNAAFIAQYQASQIRVESAVISEIDSDCLQATKLWLTHALPIIKPLIIDEPLPINQSLSANKLVTPQREEQQAKELSA